MIENYQKALREIRAFRPEKNLVSSTWSYELDSNLTESEAFTEKKSEKETVLSSLDRFAQDKTEKDPEKTFKFSGGEIHSTDKASVSIPVEGRDYSSLIREKFTSNIQEYFLSKSHKDYKVVFVTDEFELESESIFFNEEVDSLFNRMATAMGLTPESWSMIAFDELMADQQTYLEMISHWRPQLIICFGASATMKLLGEERRLKDIHGRLEKVEFNIKVESNHFCQVMPLFSPKLLVTAPNMKKITWQDMQKAMKFLNTSV